MTTTVANYNTMTLDDLVAGGDMTKANYDPATKNAQLAAESDRVAMFSGLAKITVGTTPDPTPSVGDLWVDTN